MRVNGWFVNENESMFRGRLMLAKVTTSQLRLKVLNNVVMVLLLKALPHVARWLNRVNPNEIYRAVPSNH